MLIPCFQVSEQKVATLEEEKKHLEFMNEMKKFDDSESGTAAVSDICLLDTDIDKQHTSYT